MSQYKKGEGPPQGFHTYDPEVAREISSKAGKRSAEVRKNKKFWTELMKSEGLHGTAASEFLEKHPDAIKQLTDVVFQQALQGNEKSQGLLVSLLGLDAPKRQQVETKQEEMSVEDAQRVLRAAMANAKVVGDD